MSRPVSLLISMLVRNPEVGTVKYEPRHQTIRLSLLLNGEVSDAEWDRLEEAFFDTLEVYHMIEQRAPTVAELTCESYGEVTSVTITRDVATLSPEEIYVILEFFRERFPGRLVTEPIDSPEDEMLAQDELIEEILHDLQQGRSNRNLIAIREDGRVMVFQK